jgi:Bacterial Ig-like domain (group 3)/TIR domain
MSGTARAVFLSYRREETRHIAGRLADRLTERLGSTQVFIDVDMIEPGSDFAATIVREVASCGVLIALIGPTWSTIADPRGRRRVDDPDDLVVLEIRTALERGIRVIPVLVDGAVMPDRYDLPQGLQGLTLRNAVQLDHETFRTDVVTLLDAVERVLPTLAQKAAEPTVGTDDRLIDRARADRDRSAYQGIAHSRRRWIARLAGPTGLDTTAGRLLTEGDGHGWPRSRKLLAGVMAIVLSVSGVLLATLSNRSTPTTTALTTTAPVSLLAQGSPVTFTASITPSAAAGTVQFKDGTTNIGNPVTVSNGTASKTTSTLSVGTHQLTAVFTPSDPAPFAPSRSPAVTFTVTTQG